MGVSCYDVYTDFLTFDVFTTVGLETGYANGYLQNTSFL